MGREPFSDNSQFSHWYRWLREERGGLSLSFTRVYCFTAYVRHIRQASSLIFTSQTLPFLFLSSILFALIRHPLSPMKKLLTWVKLKFVKVTATLRKAPQAPDLAFSNCPEVRITPFMPPANL